MGSTEKACVSLEGAGLGPRRELTVGQRWGNGGKAWKHVEPPQPSRITWDFSPQWLTALLSQISEIYKSGERLELTTKHLQF